MTAFSSGLSTHMSVMWGGAAVQGQEVKGSGGEREEEAKRSLNRWKEWWDGEKREEEGRGEGAKEKEEGKGNGEEEGRKKRISGRGVDTGRKDGGMRVREG